MILFAPWDLAKIWDVSHLYRLRWVPQEYKSNKEIMVVSPFFLLDKSFWQTFSHIPQGITFHNITAILNVHDLKYLLHRNISPLACWNIPNPLDLDIYCYVGDLATDLILWWFLDVFSKGFWLQFCGIYMFISCMQLFWNQEQLNSFIK